MTRPRGSPASREGHRLGKGPRGRRHHRGNRCDPRTQEPLVAVRPQRRGGAGHRRRGREPYQEQILRGTASGREQARLKSGSLIPRPMAMRSRCWQPVCRRKVGVLPRTRRRSVHDSRNLSRAPAASLRDRLRRPLTEPDCRQDRQLSGSGEGPGTGQGAVTAPGRLRRRGQDQPLSNSGHRLPAAGSGSA